MNVYLECAHQCLFNYLLRKVLFQLKSSKGYQVAIFTPKQYLSIINLFIKNSQPIILPSSFGMFMAPHLTKNAKCLAGEVDFVS
jgi:hypothetical protein